MDTSRRSRLDELAFHAIQMLRGPYSPNLPEQSSLPSPPPPPPPRPKLTPIELVIYDAVRGWVTLATHPGVDLTKPIDLVVDDGWHGLVRIGRLLPLDQAAPGATTIPVTLHTEPLAGMRPGEKTKAGWFGADFGGSAEDFARRAAGDTPQPPRRLLDDVVAEYHAKLGVAQAAFHRKAAEPEKTEPLPIPGANQPTSSSDFGADDDETSADFAGPDAGGSAGSFSATDTQPQALSNSNASLYLLDPSGMGAYTLLTQRRQAEIAEAAAVAQQSREGAPGSSSDGLPYPSGAAAGQLVPGSGPGNPGNAKVTPEAAASMLRNITEGIPPWRPEMGQNGVAWFVTAGKPYIGTDENKSVPFEVEVLNLSGKPPLRFREADLVAIRNSYLPAARALVERQVRESNRLDDTQPLNRESRRAVEIRAKKVAEKEMWGEVGRRTAASESGMSVVELRSSEFSRKGDGDFTLTRDPKSVRVKGGAQGLIEIIKKNGVPAEQSIVDAAQKIAESQKWGGRIEGVFRVGGKVLIVVGLLGDAYKIYTATDKIKATAEVIGGWAAATAAGGAYAVATAPLDLAGPVAWTVNGVGILVVGGVAYWGGSLAADKLYELAVENTPITVSGY